MILLAIVLQITYCFCQETKLLTCEEAISIALNESYTIKSYLENKKAMQSYFIYNKAQFKPRLDFNVFTPNWNEAISQINRADSLPVFNSTGSFKMGGDLSFTYTLPTGGNFALHSTLYQENLKTVLESKEYSTLTTDQAYTNVGVSFEQPIFTKNTLQENLIVAEYQYQQASNYYTRGQMDIVYNVTKGFYSLYRATREVEINQEKLKNSQEAYRIARLKLGAMRIAEAEALIAEVQVEQDKAKLSESKSSLEREKDIFKQLVCTWNKVLE
jgi:outer membrane protein